MHDDTLVFMPITPFFDGDTIELTLIEAYDLLGNPTTDIDLGFFIFDFSAPYLVANYPPDGEFLSLPVPDFIMTIRDDLSGIDETSFSITVNGTP